jgi:hypothetical protein
MDVLFYFFASFRKNKKTGTHYRRRLEKRFICGRGAAPLSTVGGD